MTIQFTVKTKIQKPVAEVFDAVRDPAKLSAYFTTAGASAPLEAGQTVMWDFADFPGAFPVHVRELVENEKVVLEWKAGDGDYNTTVTMTFNPSGDNATELIISEAGWQDTLEGRKNSYGNCQGWSQMACCLKAYMEHGINLRQGMY